MAGVVVHQFLLTKSTSEAENFTEQSLKPICIGEKYGYWMYTTTGIIKINFSGPQVPKSSRFIHRQMSLGTVLLFKLPLYESCETKFAKVRWFSEVPGRRKMCSPRSWDGFEILRKS